MRFMLRSVRLHDDLQSLIFYKPHVNWLIHVYDLCQEEIESSTVMTSFNVHAIALNFSVMPLKVPLHVPSSFSHSHKLNFRWWWHSLSWEWELSGISVSTYPGRQIYMCCVKPPSWKVNVLRAVWRSWTQHTRERRMSEIKHKSWTSWCWCSSYKLLFYGWKHLDFAKASWQGERFAA